MAFSVSPTPSYPSYDYSKGPRSAYYTNEYYLKLYLNVAQTDDDDEWGRTNNIILRSLVDHVTDIWINLYGSTPTSGGGIAGDNTKLLEIVDATNSKIVLPRVPGTLAEANTSASNTVLKSGSLSFDGGTGNLGIFPSSVKLYELEVRADQSSTSKQIRAFDSSYNGNFSLRFNQGSGSNPDTLKIRIPFGSSYYDFDFSSVGVVFDTNVSFSAGQTNLTSVSASTGSFTTSTIGSYLNITGGALTFTGYTGAPNSSISFDSSDTTIKVDHPGIGGAGGLVRFYNSSTASSTLDINTQTNQLEVKTLVSGSLVKMASIGGSSSNPASLNDFPAFRWFDGSGTQTGLLSVDEYKQYYQTGGVYFSGGSIKSDVDGFHLIDSKNGDQLSFLYRSIELKTSVTPNDAKVTFDFLSTVVGGMNFYEVTSGSKVFGIGGYVQAKGGVGYPSIRWYDTGGGSEFSYIKYNELKLSEDTNFLKYASLTFPDGTIATDDYGLILYHNVSSEYKMDLNLFKLVFTYDGVNTMNYAYEGLYLKNGPAMLFTGTVADTKTINVLTDYFKIIDPTNTDNEVRVSNLSDITTLSVYESGSQTMYLQKDKIGLANAAHLLFENTGSRYKMYFTTSSASNYSMLSMYLSGVRQETGTVLDTYEVGYKEYSALSASDKVLIWNG